MGNTSYDDVSASVKSGFWNSSGSDVRTYYNSDFSTLMNLLINDGVFQTSNSDHFLVEPVSGQLQVKVNPGKAWFDNTWIYNKTIITVNLDEAPEVDTYRRKDLIAIKIDSSESVRKGTIEYIVGTPGSNPSEPILTNSTYVKWHKLAAVTVKYAATAITAAEITNYIGTTTTPFITGILETIDITELMSQWNSTISQWYTAQQNSFISWRNGEETTFEAWESDEKAAFEAWESDEKAAFEAWESDEKAAFEAWFETIRNIFDGDIAGHLQNEIDDIVNGALIQANEFDEPSTNPSSSDGEEEEVVIEDNSPISGG